MPDILLAGAARLLVLLHAAAAIVLVGAATHHAIVAVGYLRGKVFKVRLGRIYAVIVAIAYAITFGFGLLVYPTFRYHARALYLDRYEHWAANLFDMKENFAALGIPFVIGTLVMSRVLDPKTDRLLVGPYTAFTLLTAAIIWFDVIAGLLITMTRGV
jgi:hypothetical protein